MSKVLLFSRDPLPIKGYAATGGGLRSLSIVKGLESRGHKVFVAYPEKVVSLFPQIVDDETFYSYSLKNIDTIFDIVKPDVVIQEGVGEIDHLERVNVPIVFDLPGPRLMESQYLNVSLETDVLSKISSLSLGDYFICSNQRQKYYYFPWLTLCGFDLRKDIIDVLPYSTSVILPEREPFGGAREPAFVWGGLFWPWQRCDRALNVVLNLLDKLDCGKLEVIGGKFPFEYSRIKDFSNFTEGLNDSNRLECIDLLPYDEMLKTYTDCTVAIDLADNSHERELASPFRTIDYLASGLPVILSESMELSKIIVEYEAGWAINPDNHEALGDIVKSVINDPDKVTAYSRNAQRLVRERFVWGKGIDPLDKFCRKPVKRKKGNTVFENIIHLKVGEAFRDKGYYDDAINKFSEIVESGKDKEWVHFELGLTYKEAGNYQKALLEMEAEDGLYPEKAAAKTEIGHISYMLGEYDRALHILEQSLKIDPFWEWTHYHIGLVFIKINKYTEAISHFEEIGNLSPSRVYVLYNLGAIYKSLKDYEKSEYFYNQILKEYVAVGYLDEASLKELLSGTNFHLGEIYKLTGKEDKAMNHFRKCLSINPVHGKAKEYLG